MPTYYMDFEGGSDAADGLSFANRWKTFATGATPARTAPGDTIRIMASPDPTSLGINATWTDHSPTVTLASSLNTLITDCDSVWTASANVTCTVNTSTYRTSTGSASIAIAGAFTTGLAAYFALGGAQDYSSFQGITLWIRTGAAISAGSLSIRLCSDTVGAVTVDTLAIPAIPAASVWVPLYIDKGSALGASIQSIALYADTDPGTVTVLLDNISTVKAVGNDNLNLTSLISKNTGSEIWWALRSINGTSLLLDTAVTATPATTPPGYSGTTESVTIYKRETIKTTMGVTNTHLVQKAGTSGNLIRYTGGWNRTDMSTQAGLTFSDGQASTGSGFVYNSLAYVGLEKCYAVRYSTGFNLTGANAEVGEIGAIACTNLGVEVHPNATNSTVGSISVTQGLTVGVLLQGNGVTVGPIKVHGFGATGNTAINFGARGCSVTSMDLQSLSGTAVLFGSAASNNLTVGSLTIDTASDGISQTVVDLHDIWIKSCSISFVSGTAMLLRGGINYRIDNVTLTNNTTGLSISGVADATTLVLGSLTTSGNTTAVTIPPFTGVIHVLASSFAEVTPLVFTGSPSFHSGRLVFQNYDGAANDHRTYYSNGSTGATVFADSTTRHSSSGLSWRFNLQSTNFVTANFPIAFPVARIAVNANKQVTASIWTRRSSTSMVGTFRAKGGQLTGITNDVTSSSSAAINTWQQLQLVFTPTETGVMDLDFTVYGVTSADLFIHDFTVVQAP